VPKFDRDRGGIHDEVHGGGPPLPPTHGYAAAPAMWRSQIALLSRHHKFVLWDVRGLKG
jgi:hypothetical protein